MCVVPHPCSPEVFLCGGYSSVVKAWDSRSCKVRLIILLLADMSFLFLPSATDYILLIQGIYALSSCFVLYSLQLDASSNRFSCHTAILYCRILLHEHEEVVSLIAQSTLEFNMGSQK